MCLRSILNPWLHLGLLPQVAKHPCDAVTSYGENKQCKTTPDGACKGRVCAVICVISGQGRMQCNKPILVTPLILTECCCWCCAHRTLLASANHVSRRRGGRGVWGASVTANWPGNRSHSSSVETAALWTGSCTSDWTVQSKKASTQGPVSFSFNRYPWDSSGLPSSASSTAFESPLSTAELTAAPCEIFHLSAEGS